MLPARHLYTADKQAEQFETSTASKGNSSTHCDPPQAQKMKLDNKERDPSLPPPYTPSRPPPSGYRIALNAASPFPDPTYTKEPPCHDNDSANTPIFLGSAIFNNSVHPCKIGPCLVPPCRVPYGGSEVEHRGRYDLLPFDKETMEWVPTSLGRIPTHRRPVQGGYEENGANLYHTMATIRGTRVPGKAGEHLVSIPVHVGLASNDLYSTGRVSCSLWRGGAYHHTWVRHIVSQVSKFLVEFAWINAMWADAGNDRHYIRLQCLPIEIHPCKHLTGPTMVTKGATIIHGGRDFTPTAYVARLMYRF